MVNQIAPSNKLIEELLRDAELAEEPGGFHENDVIHRPDGELPAPMVTAVMRSAGHVYIYDTETRERSITNRNMLQAQLEKKRPDGSSAFTTVAPLQPPARGTFKCLLHKDQPERAHYDTLGLPTCPKANIPSLYMVGQHMAHRHSTANATIESEREAREKAEDREFQRSLVRIAGGSGALAAGSQTAPPRRKRKVVKPTPVKASEEPSNA